MLLQMLQHLSSSIKEVRSTAALVVGKIASAEIPAKTWTEVVPALTSAIESSSSSNELKQASFEALGYVCEEVGFSLFCFLLFVAYHTFLFRFPINLQPTLNPF
jgi:hypothetical protein